MQRTIKPNATRKLLDVDNEAIKLLTIESIKKDFKSFKLYAEFVLEEKAKKLKK